MGKRISNLHGARGLTSFNVPSITNFEHYVFFESIFDDTILAVLGKQAKKIYSNIGATLSTGNDYTKTDKLDEKFNLIYQYTNMIKNLAEKKRKNEIDFINHLLNILSQINDNSDDKQKYEKMKKMAEGFSSNEVDYDNFMFLINELLHKNKDWKIDLIEEKRNAEYLRQAISNIEDGAQEQLAEAYIHDYKHYRKQLLEKLYEKKDEKYIYGDALKIFKERIKTRTEKKADKINQVLRSLGKNNDFISYIENTLQKNQDLTGNGIMSIILQILGQKDLLAEGENPKKIAEDTIQELQNILTNPKNSKEKEKYIRSKVGQVLTQSDKKSKFIFLEKLAMREKGKFKKLAETFEKMADQEKLEIIKEYDNDQNDIFTAAEKLRDAINNGEPVTKIAYLRRTLTKELGEQIQSKLTEKIKKENKDLDNKQWSEMQKAAEKYYQGREQKKDTGFRKLLNVSRLSASSAAELLGAIDMGNLVQAAAQTPGKQIQYKTDISFTIGFDPNILQEDPDFINNLNLDLGIEYEKLLPTYQELSGGATDVGKAYEAYTTTIENMAKELEQKIEQANLENDKKQQLLGELHNFITGEVSVKQYIFLNEQLGYHGGSLGGSGSCDDAINNIVKMYELGGIDHIDAEDLIFYAINSNTIGNGNIDNLAQYLLGGAALIMFEQSFSSTQNFIDKTTNTLLQSFTPVELYRLNTAYVPASYILETIYQNLIPITSNIQTSINIKKSSQNKVVISPHGLTRPIAKYEGKQINLANERWEETAQTAKDETKISFLFMAGMIDIMKGILRAFSKF